MHVKTTSLTHRPVKVIWTCLLLCLPHNQLILSQYTFFSVAILLLLISLTTDLYLFSVCLLLMSFCLSHLGYTCVFCANYSFLCVSGNGSDQALWLTSKKWKNWGYLEKTEGCIAAVSSFGSQSLQKIAKIKEYTVLVTSEYEEIMGSNVILA